jgi:hypothetical protein
MGRASVSLEWRIDPRLDEAFPDVSLFGMKNSLLFALEKTVCSPATN